jgi:hypothetical protein
MSNFSHYSVSWALLRFKKMSTRRRDYSRTLCSAPPVVVTIKPVLQEPELQSTVSLIAQLSLINISKGMGF